MGGGEGKKGKVAPDVWRTFGFEGCRCLGKTGENSVVDSRKLKPFHEGLLDARAGGGKN